MRKATALLLERWSAACLGSLYLMAVLPNIRGGRTFLQSWGVVASVYVAIAFVPLLLIVIGQRKLWVLRVAGWLMLCALAFAVIVAG